MFDSPKDVPGQCNARLYISDDYGDNEVTMRCSMPPGHEGMHKEEWTRSGSKVIIQWEKDERVEEEDESAGGSDEG